MFQVQGPDNVDGVMDFSYSISEILILRAPSYFSGALAFEHGRHRTLWP